MVDKNDWKVTYNNKNGKFLTSKIIEGIKEEQEILLIKLKVRDDLKEGETEVKLQEITSNDGVNLVSDGNKSIKIKIKGNNSKIIQKIIQRIIKKVIKIPMKKMKNKLIKKNKIL